MAMAGERHVLIAVETHAHRLAGVMRRERGERGRRRGLRFLAAETSAHARHLHHDFVRGQMQNVRHDLLDFGWMLCRRSNEYRTVLAAFSPRRIRLQIEMFLTAEFKITFKRQRRFRYSVVAITATDEVRFVVKTYFGDGVTQRKDRRERRVFDDDLLRRRATRCLRFTDHERDELAVKEHLVHREQRLIVLRAHVVQAGNILGKQHGFDAGHLARGGGVAFQNLCLRVGRANRPDFEHPVRAVVHIHRLARNVFVRAFVWNCLCRRRREESLTDFGFRFETRHLVSYRIGIKLLQQTRDQTAAIFRRAAHVGNGRELRPQNRQHTLNCFLAPDFSEQGRFSFLRAGGHRGDTAVAEPCVADDALRIHIHHERARHRADVHLAAFGNFEPLELARVSRL